MDITLAVIVFIVAIFAVYFIVSNNNDISNLHQDAERISKETTSEDSSLGIVTDGKLDEMKIQGLLNTSYDELVKKIRTGNDFCIYFVDKDGSLVTIDSADDFKEAVGVGNPDIKLNNKSCGELILK